MTRNIPWQVTNFLFYVGCRGSTPAVGALPPHPHNFQVYELTRCISQLGSPTALAGGGKAGSGFSRVSVYHGEDR
jgi:hypothetical protein